MLACAKPNEYDPLKDPAPGGKQPDASNGPRGGGNENPPVTDGPLAGPTDAPPPPTPDGSPVRPPDGPTSPPDSAAPITPDAPLAPDAAPEPPTCPTAGMTCTPTDQPCKTGKIECVGGSPRCNPTGNETNGKSCGNARVCRDGSCVDLKDRQATCNANDECKSGSCVGGHCCNGGEKFCDGQCRAGGYCCNGTACPISNGAGSCSGGDCQLSSCNSGFKPQGNQCVRVCGNVGEPCCDGSCNGAGRCIDGRCQAPCPAANCTRRCLDSRHSVQGCKNVNGCDVEDVVSCDGFGGSPLGQCNEFGNCEACGDDKCCDQRGDTCGADLICRICNSRSLVFKNCVNPCEATVTPTGMCICR